MLGTNIVNRMTDRQTDSLSHTLTMKGSFAGSSVTFSPVVWEMLAWLADGWTDGHRTVRRQMDAKIMLLSHTFTIRGSHVASLVKFCPVV